MHMIPELRSSFFFLRKATVTLFAVTGVYIFGLQLLNLAGVMNCKTFFIRQINFFKLPSATTV